VRGDLPLLDRAQALEYLESVRERVPDEDSLLHELVVRHEDQHQETMLQAIGLARLQPAPAIPRAARPPAPGGHTGLEAVDVPAGPCEIGAPEDRFAYDNERPRHRVKLPGFRIGRTPVTNATFLRFVEDGGYERREWWSEDGWSWRRRHDITQPQGWAHDGDWRRWTPDGWAPLDPDEPVIHVSWFEADALARAHGARLPTELEWEKAATGVDEAHANLDQALLGPAPAGAYPEGASAYGALGMLGDVWEWTASDFGGYDGFVAHPYREYSEVFFGDEYKVLRGGSWATRSRVATPSFRNWDLPQRRQIFSGVRLAWDA